MKAAVFHDRRRVSIEEVADPVAGAGELVLEVRAAGVCGTDAAEYAHGPSMFPIHDPHPVTGHHGPLVPGHEFGGTVVSVGEAVSGFEAGDVVASGAGMSCGACDQCRAGMTNVCARYATVGLSRHGGLAQYVATPAEICLEVGSLGLTPDTAALVQPMAIAHHAFRRGRPMRGQTVVIIGVGGIGAFLTYVAAHAGHPAVAADLDPDRLQIAQALGAAHTVDPASEDLGAVVDDLGGLPLVYEVTGTAGGFESAWRLTPPGGKLVAVGVQKEMLTVDVRGLTLGERQLIGTNAHAAADDLPAAARLVAERVEGWSDVAPWIFPLELLISEGLEPMAKGRTTRIKTLFDPWTDQPRRLGV